MENFLTLIPTSHFAFCSHDMDDLKLKNTVFNRWCSYLISFSMTFNHTFRHSKAQIWLSCMSVECWNLLEFQRIYPSTYRVNMRQKKKIFHHGFFDVWKVFFGFGASIVTTTVHTARGSGSPLLCSHTSHIIHQHPVAWYLVFFFLNIHIICMRFAFGNSMFIFNILHFTCHPWLTWLQFSCISQWW